MRQPPPPTVPLRPSGRFRQSWAAACLFSLVLHGALFHLTHANLSVQQVRLPVQAYLMQAVDQPSSLAPLSAPEKQIVAPDKVNLENMAAVPLSRSARQIPKLRVEDLQATRAAALAPTSQPSTEQVGNPAPSPPPGRDIATQEDSLSAAPTTLLELQILQWLERHRQYPRSALRSGLQGDVGVRFVLDRRGRLLRAEVVRSSGYKLLDQAALALLHRAQPFPLPALDPGIDRLELSLPVAYRIAPGRS